MKTAKLVLIAAVMAALLGCASKPKPSDVLIVKGRIVSCWDEAKLLDVLSLSGELTHLDVHGSMPTCASFKQTGTWTIHYHKDEWGHIYFDWVGLSK